MHLTLMYITNNPDIALIAQKYGVERIWIDLETLGKEERQKDIDSVKSNHSVDDIKTIAPLLHRSEMLVRINPINSNSKIEIEQVIEAGADIIMLPMWKSVDEVKLFVDLVDRRTKTTLLLETKEAVDCIDGILKLGGFDEVHIGLNDLHLSYGMKFMFELLANGMVEFLCNKIREAGLPYGFGGIARIGEGLLPSEKIILEHYRLGSSRAILSRTFCDNTLSITEVEKVFSENMKILRDYENYVAKLRQTDLLINRTEVSEDVQRITNLILN